MIKIEFIHNEVSGFSFNSMNAKKRRAQKHHAHMYEFAGKFDLSYSSKAHEKGKKALPRWRRVSAQFDGGTWIKCGKKQDCRMP